MTTNPDSALAYLLRHRNSIQRPAIVIHAPGHPASPKSLAKNETMWQRIRRAFTR